MDNKSKNDEIKPASAKWFGIIGFLIAIVLLTIAIFLSINQEKTERLSKLNDIQNTNKTEEASSILSKNINEVKANEILNTASANQTSTNNSNANKNLKTSRNEELIQSTNSNETKNETKKVNSNITNSTESNSSNSNKKSSTNSDKASNNVADNNKNSDKNNSNKKTEAQFTKPADGQVSNEYSMDSLIYSNTLQEWVTHRGIDIKGELGENIVSVAAGTVTSIKNDPRYGLSITIEHSDGFKSIYSCLLSTEDGLEEGTKISQGQVIAKMGNSGVFESEDGAHLHFELMQNGDYINPELYIK